MHHVSDLITSNTFQWDRGKVLYLCLIHKPLITFWRFISLQHSNKTSHFGFHNSNGILWVKSVNLTVQEQRFSSTGPLTSTNWNTLWKAKISTCHKHFLWKLAWEILPTKGTIAARFQISDQTCMHFHLFFKCLQAQSVWLSSSWPIHIDRLPFSSAVEWVNFILNPQKFLNLQLQEAQSFTLLAAVICDQLWYHRNTSSTSTRTTPSASPTSLPLLIREINKAFLFHKQAWEYTICHSTLSQPLNWSPPPPGCFIVNFDAVLRPRNIFLAAVCWNHLGKITHAWTKVVVCGEPLWVEANAGLFAVSSKVVNT